MGNYLWLIPCFIIGILVSTVVNLRFGSSRYEAPFILIHYGIFAFIVLLIIAAI